MFFDIDFSYNSEVRGGLNEGLQFKIGPSWEVNLVYESKRNSLFGFR